MNRLGKFDIIRQIKLPKFIADLTSILGSRIVLLVLGFLGSIMLARLLGPEKKGIITVVLVIPGMVLTFADLGIRQSATYYLGKKVFADQDILSSLSFLTIFTSIIAVLFIVLAYLATGLPNRYGWIVVFIALGMVPFSILASYTKGVLLAKRRVQQLALATVIEKVGYVLLLLFLFVPMLRQVEWALLANLTATVFGTLYVARTIRKYGHFGPRYIPPIPWILVKRGIVFSIALFILKLNYRVDIIMLEKMTNATEVGIYTVGVGLAEMLWMLPAAMATVNFSYSASSDNVYKHALKTAKLLRVTFWVALVPCLILYFASPILIPAVYGQAFLNSGSIVQAILLGIWTGLIFKILNSDLAGRGKPEAALWVYLLTLLINILLNLWWIPIFKGIGSAWASSISYTIGALIFALAYSRMSQMSLNELLLPRISDFQEIISKQLRKY